jgi:ankyrin repeat protein
MEQEKLDEVSAASKRQTDGLFVIAGFVLLLVIVGSSVYLMLPSKRDLSIQMIEAAEKGKKDKVSGFLDRAADVNFVHDGKTALYSAAKAGHREIVKLLLDRSANVKSGVDQGSSALQVAVEAGHLEIVRLLLERGSAVNDSETDCSYRKGWGGSGVGVCSTPIGHYTCHWTPLMSAAYHGHTEIVSLLLQNGANVNACGDKGHTALWLACQTSSFDSRLGIVKLLLDYGGEVNVAEDNGPTALSLAKKNGSRTVQHLLEAYGAWKL